MSYTFYIIFHLIGVISLIYALGGLTLHKLNGGSSTFKNRKMTMILHGVSLVIIFISAFGLLARIGVTWPWPLWVWGKLILWLSLGGIASFILRSEKKSRVLYFLVILLAILAILLVELKPS